MPDFGATFTAGVTGTTWEDPASGGKPTRINPRPGLPHRRRVGSVGVQLTVTAVVAGVSAPLDAALGGRLFTGTLAETPGALPPVTSPGGQSSVQRFTPTVAGHYTFVMRRQDGGGQWLHVDVV